MGEKKTCGDFGGRKANGEPCTRPAGWGTDNNKGRCKSHTKEKESKIQDTKKRFLKILKENAITIKKAASNLNMDQSTIWNWRQVDEKFDKKVEEAKNVQREIRADRVEDALFRDAIKGDATGGERIFLLKNLRPDKWKDSPQIKVNQYQNQTIAKKEENILKIVKEAKEKINEYEYE